MTFDTQPSRGPKSIRIDFEPLGRRVTVPQGDSILKAAQLAGIDLVAICGGIGVCGACRVRLIEGRLSPLTGAERKALGSNLLAEGFRLACKAHPLTDVRIEIPPESLNLTQKLQLEGIESTFDLAPAVIPVDIQLSPPELTDLRADLTRVSQRLDGLGYPPLSAGVEMLAMLSNRLRDWNWTARIAIIPGRETSELVGILPFSQPLLGLAADLGSTKLAFYLVNLENGAILTQTGRMNPQIAYGEDVVSRIAFANQGVESKKKLQTRLIETVNQVAAKLCKEVNVNPDWIVDSVFVGNTVMHHLFCGLPVRQLGTAPYIPAVSEPLSIRAQEIGLDFSPGARAYLPANIAGYVGADHTAALLAGGFFEDDRTAVLVDIGTNTEISLMVHGKIFSCSTASGPAFEGAHIRDGMRAAPGAVDDVIFSDGKWEISTIDDRPPVGICGTGILNAISALLDTGTINDQGRLVSGSPWIKMENNVPAFVVSAQGAANNNREILITRKDVHEIQLAKGAIRAGIEVLLEEAGIGTEDVQDWIIAGAFGTYLRLESAIRIGMLPRVPLERFVQVGNAAGVGARQMLLSTHKREQARLLAEKAEYIELTTYLKFTEKFVESMFFQ